jgi:UDP-N-acetylmuramate-alanine ligase
MNIKLFEKLYFIGVGGIGMSALARYFNSKGLEVCGYDKTPSELTNQLQEEGIDIHLMLIIFLNTLKLLIIIHYWWYIHQQ